MPQIYRLGLRSCALLFLCALSCMIPAVPAWATARQVLEELIRGTTRVADDVPLRRTDEILAKLSKSKAMQDMIERELQTAGKMAGGVGKTVPMVARSRKVLQFLRQATTHLDPSIIRRLEHLDGVTRESALVLARGGEHLTQTLPDLAIRGRFLREAGSETVAAIGLHGSEAAREALRLHTAIKAGTLVLPRGHAAITLADFGAAMTKSSQASWQFWKTYVQPHWKLWLGSGALAAYLVNPEAFQNASAQLTEAGFQHLTELAGEVTAAAIRGTGQGAGQATYQVGRAVQETYFNGWQGFAAAVGTVLVVGAALCTFRRVRFYVCRPLRWLQESPENYKENHHAS